MVTLFKRMDKYDETSAKLNERIGAVERVTLQRGVVYHAIDKVVWILIGALAAYGARLL